MFISSRDGSISFSLHLFAPFISFCRFRSPLPLLSYPEPPSLNNNLCRWYKALYMSLRPNGFCSFHGGAFGSYQYIKQNIGCWQWNEAQKTNTISDSFALKTCRPNVLQVVAATVGGCVSALAQQYSAATPASPLLHFVKQKYGAAQKVITSSSFIIIIIFCRIA